MKRIWNGLFLWLRSYIMAIIFLIPCISLIVFAIAVISPLDVKDSVSFEDAAFIFSFGGAIGLVGSVGSIFAIYKIAKTNRKKAKFEKLFGFKPTSHSQFSKKEELNLEKEIISNLVNLELNKMVNSENKKRIDEFLKKIKANPKTVALLKEYEILKGALKNDLFSIKNLADIIEESGYEIPKRLEETIDEMEKLT